MTKIASLSIAIVVVALLAVTDVAAKDAAAGLERIKALAGEWTGTSPKGPVRVSYEVVSGGTAVIERLMPMDEPVMVSVYHMDGPRLVMTHYCSAGNQPRMRADVPDGEIKSLSFEFLDCTNLSKPTDGHMRAVAFTFDDADHMTQTWTWHEGDTDKAGTFTFERKK